MMKQTTVIALTAVAMGVGFDLLFFHASRLGLNVLLAEALFLLTSWGIARMSGHVLPRRAQVAATFAALFAATFAVWTSDYGLAVSLFGFFAANLLFVAFAIGHEAHFIHPIGIFGTGTFEVMIRLLSRLDIFAELRFKAFSPRQWSVILGLLCMVPIVFVFVILFANADAVFLTYVQDVLAWVKSFADIPTLIQHLVIIGIVAVGATLFFAAAFWQRFTIPPAAELTPRFELESKVILWGVVAVFAFFIALQTHTLFGGTQALASLGLTYAQYARSGFYELLVAAIFVAIVILTLRALHGVKGDRHLHALHLVLIGETCLVLVSAGLRMSLYIDAYGYTPARLLATSAMATLGVLLILMAENIAARQSQAVMMRRGLVILGVAGLLFTASAPDSLSLRLNINRALAHRQPIDSSLFVGATEEAAPEIYQVLSSGLPIEGILQTPGSNEQCQRDLEARRNLTAWLNRSNRSRQTLAEPSSWRAWNLARFRAANLPIETVVTSWNNLFTSPCATWTPHDDFTPLE